MKLKLNSAPFCPPEGYAENQPWFIPFADIPETPSQAKAKTLTPKAKAEVESPLIADARRRAGEDEITNPLIRNAKKRAGKAQEVHHV